jgi:hypothetical protein
VGGAIHQQPRRPGRQLLHKVMALGTTTEVHQGRRERQWRVDKRMVDGGCLVDGWVDGSMNRRMVNVEEVYRGWTGGG